ncbi:hypothetical protein [Bacillus smithii]|uniref:hypothetical protein n=1 Tax=Bacillus smithii TaxID=1479 RepID=UPI002E204D3B|nr:hypothetical protein [Bacillus smithii]
MLHYKTDIAFVVKEKWTEPDIDLFHIVDIHYWFIVPKGHKYDGKEVLSLNKKTAAEIGV